MVLCDNCTSNRRLILLYWHMGMSSPQAIAFRNFGPWENIVEQPWCKGLYQASSHMKYQKNKVDKTDREHQMKKVRATLTVRTWTTRKHLHNTDAADTGSLSYALRAPPPLACPSSLVTITDATSTLSLKALAWDSQAWPIDASITYTMLSGCYGNRDSHRIAYTTSLTDHFTPLHMFLVTTGLK